MTPLFARTRRHHLSVRGSRTAADARLRHAPDDARFAKIRAVDVSRILEPLNSVQREAVAAPPGHVLVLAGAGSGKTRVLVHRIAWLIETEGVSAFGILAVTFTNKAAGEMRGRIESLLGVPAAGMWVGTFHGLAHRLLRSHWQEAGLPQSFQILDAEDQYRLIRRILKAQGLDEAHWPAKQVQWFINGKKDEGLRPKHLEDPGDPYQRQLIRLYAAYDEACRRSGLVDFAELLLRAHELWRQQPQLLQHYQHRFRHILVDEFQDTNTLQYAWLRVLAGDAASMFVVGDDDQSIYGWRGARIENIHRFGKDFHGAITVRLEQNYRSTGTILAASNALIANNAGRLGKELWTSGERGEPIRLFSAFNEFDEARYVVEEVQHWTRQGNRRDSVAVLYRSNAQSRVLEEALISAGIPYRVYGGLRFFERAEIKDALAYLRLIANRRDDAAFERIVNTPTRGIGGRSLETLRSRARERGTSLWEALLEVGSDASTPARGATALSMFIELIGRLEREITGVALHEQVDHVVKASGLLEHYRKDKGEKGRARVENLEELVTAARQFDYEQESDGISALDAFLAHAALEAGEGQGGTWEDCVQLMTLHSAKGLEFPVVFICGMEEGLFPHQLSVEEPGRLEEERRLCYVGMTRAKQTLHITHAESRRLYGSETFSRPSQFLGEIPKELVHETRVRTRVTLPTSVAREYAATSGAADGFRLGQRVRHEKFGDGVILHHEGDGSHARVQVKFEGAGSKWLMVAYANLQAL